jgi:hypothetical protein
MKKLKLQIAIGTIGLISTAIGIWTLLQTPTMILTPLFLVGLYLPIAFIISLIVGFLIKVLLKSSWHTLTFAALTMTVICLTFYGSQYKPSYKIIIPETYVGEVKLLLSNETENDFKVNNFGIGYISKKTYENGFRPTIIKSGQDISKQITGYSTGSHATTSSSNLSLDYLSFEIPGKVDSTFVIDFDCLLKLKAIDTKRLRRK